MKLEGIIKKGHGRATFYTQKQKPFFKQLDLRNVEKLRDGTINLDISPLTFRALKYDHFFEDVIWDETRVETFGFVEIEEITYNGKNWEKPGYIYVPHNSPHFKNKIYMEVVAVEIPGITAGDKIALGIEEGKIELYIDH